MHFVLGMHNPSQKEVPSHFFLCAAVLSRKVIVNALLVYATLITSFSSLSIP